MPVTLTHLEHQAAEGEHAPPLLIAHGLFGSARNFNTLGRRLATTRRVVMVDMRNHGASPWDPDNSYPALADDLGEAVTRLCGGRAVPLGQARCVDLQLDVGGAGGRRGRGSTDRGGWRGGGEGCLV